ncbi:MAG TPA: murein biosynthesis integral membrane protein MurJ [Candidatus Margulisiibacteriota bacterium]|nr:murein biosynthesis integral membrane protein MurJ [Candidatus Margulisiibacteriota bacterium]
MSENRQIARAAGLVGFFTLISRVFGLIRDSVVGYYFGTGMAADAFFVAFRIPNLLRRFVAEGAMSTAFIPVFTDYLTNRSEAEAVEAASALASLMMVGLAVLTGIGIIFAPFWTALFAPGFVEEPGKFELTVTLTRLVFPYIFLISMVALTSGMLNSLRHFAAPAISPIFLNLAMIGAAIFVCPHLAVPVRGLAYGVVAGGVMQLVLHVVPLWRRGIRITPFWAPGHEAVGRALRLMAPMVFGAAVYQINIMVDTVLASVLPSGSVSYLWYADRVFEFPLGIFAVALGTAALPSFAAQAARGAYDELRHSLSFSIRMTNFIALPAAVGIMTLATPITSVLFQRGAFGYDQAVLTAQALSAFAVGLWSVSMVRLIVPAFYAMEDTRTPVITAAGAFVANCCFSLLLMGPVGTTGESRVADAIALVTQTISVFNLRHAGLALSTSLAATVNLILLGVFLRRRLGALGARELLPSLGRSLLASLAMIPAVRYVAALTDWSAHGHLVAHATVLLMAVSAGIGVFVIVAALLGGSEVQSVTRLVRQRLLRVSASEIAGS